MGNALRFLYGKCCKPTTDDDQLQSGSLAPHGVASLAHDLFNFENTSLVPEELSSYVASSRRAQVNWYRKLLEAWKQARAPPRTPEEAASLVMQALARHRKADVEGLLAFYGLPLISIDVQTSLPEGVKFEMDTLPVDPRSVPDGDGMQVYVSTADPRESSCVPRRVQVAAVQRSQARAHRDYAIADELQQEIIDAGYRVIYLQNIGEEVLARKYRIRLRGIDAPENSMPYGKEAKDALVNIVEGKCLRVQVYEEDQYGRCVADVYCNGKFVQELMLKKGLAWHYTAYDQREEFARWERQARAKRKGLWASPNPEKPWEWRKQHPTQRSHGNGGSNSVKAYGTQV